MSQFNSVRILHVASTALLLSVVALATSLVATRSGHDHLAWRIVDIAGLVAFVLALMLAVLGVYRRKHERHERSDTGIEYQ